MCGSKRLLPHMRPRPLQYQLSWGRHQAALGIPRPEHVEPAQGEVCTGSSWSSQCLESRVQEGKICRWNSSTGRSSGQVIRLLEAPSTKSRRGAGRGCTPGCRTPGHQGALNMITLRSIMLFFQLLLNRIPFYGDATNFNEDIIDLCTHYISFRCTT